MFLWANTLKITMPRNPISISAWDVMLKKQLKKIFRPLFVTLGSILLRLSWVIGRR
jgi:hypothetical protein